jgi:hypothetical protein
MSCPFYGREFLVLPASFPGRLAKNDNPVVCVIHLYVPAILGNAGN